MAQYDLDDIDLSRGVALVGEKIIKQGTRRQIAVGDVKVVARQGIEGCDKGDRSPKDELTVAERNAVVVQRANVGGTRTSFFPRGENVTGKRMNRVASALGLEEAVDYGMINVALDVVKVGSEPNLERHVLTIGRRDGGDGGTLVGGGADKRVHGGFFVVEKGLRGLGREGGCGKKDRRRLTTSIVRRSTSMI